MKKLAALKEQHEAVLQEQKQLLEAIKTLPLEQQQKLNATINADTDLASWQQDLTEVKAKMNEWAIHATKGAEEREEALENVASWIEYSDKIQQSINERVKQHLSGFAAQQAPVTGNSNMSTPERIQYRGATYVRAESTEAFKMLDAIGEKLKGVEMQAHLAGEQAKKDGDEDVATRCEIVRLAVDIAESLIESDHVTVSHNAPRLAKVVEEFYARERK